MSAAVANIANILLGHLNPNLLNPTQAKGTPGSIPLAPQNAEIPLKAAESAAAFQNALKISVSTEKPAKTLKKLAPETPLPAFNLAANAELPQVLLKNALTNNPHPLPTANPNAPALAALAAKPKAAPPNVETAKLTLPPLTQNPAAPKTTSENPAKKALPSADKPQTNQKADSKPDTPKTQPARNTDASSAQLSPNAPKSEAPAAESTSVETRKPAPKNLQVQPPLSENRKTTPLTRNQPQPTQNPAPSAPKTSGDLNTNAAPKPADPVSPKGEPASKPPAPSQPDSNPDNTPATDSALEKAVTAQVRTASAPKKPQDTPQPKLDSPIDPARTQEIGAVLENHRPLEQPLPADNRPASLPSADPQNIARQLNEHVTATIREGKNEVSVRLNPPELGRVSIKFEQADDGITARIEVARPQTRVEIEQALPDLLRGLASAGVQFKRLEVHLAENADPNQYRHQSPADQQNQWTHHHDSQSFTPQHPPRAPHTRWFTDVPAPPLSDGSHPQFFNGSSLNMLM